MPTQAEIVSRVSSILRDAAVTTTTILGYLNEGQLKIAGGILLPDGQLTKPLEDLQTYSALTSSITLPYISLPTALASAYQRDLFMLISSTQEDRIPLLSKSAWMRFVESDYLLNSTGSISNAIVKGKRLYYNPIPTVAESLVGHYYRKPVNMATYSAATISFTVTTNVITDTANGLGVFAGGIGQQIDITGSTLNSDSFTVSTVAAGGGSMVGEEALATEAAGATVVIKSRPDGIPEGLQYALLANYACAELFRIIESRLNLKNPRCDIHEGLFMRALLDLNASLPDQPGEVIVLEDTGMYIEDGE
jgi:hypothetical protein